MCMKYAWWKILMNNSTHVPAEEWFFCRLMDSSGKKVLLRPVHKSVELVKDFVFNLYKVEELLLNTCAGTLTIEKAC